jgi:carbonic anhydrase
MSQPGETFFTVVGCMDGRVQDTVAEFGRDKLGAQFADTITEAGVVGQLAKDNPDSSLLDALKFKVVDVSLGKHHAKGIIVDGHAECAGNPVDVETHKDDIRKSVALLKKMTGGSVPVIGVFVKRKSDSAKWEVEELV